MKSTKFIWCFILLIVLVNSTNITELAEDSTINATTSDLIQAQGITDPSQYFICKVGFRGAQLIHMLKICGCGQHYRFDRGRRRIRHRCWQCLNSQWTKWNGIKITYCSHAADQKKQIVKIIETKEYNYSKTWRQVACHKQQYVRNVGAQFLRQQSLEQLYEGLQAYCVNINQCENHFMKYNYQHSLILKFKNHHRPKPDQRLTGFRRGFKPTEANLKVSLKYSPIDKFNLTNVIINTGKYFLYDTV